MHATAEEHYQFAQIVPFCSVFTVRHSAGCQLDTAGCRKGPPLFHPWSGCCLRAGRKKASAHLSVDSNALPPKEGLVPLLTDFSNPVSSSVCEQTVANDSFSKLCVCYRGNL